jgi:hypothetical protein
MKVSCQLYAMATLLRENSSRNPFKQRMDGLQSQSGCLGVEKNPLGLPGIKRFLIAACSLHPDHYIDHSVNFLVTASTYGVGFCYVSQTFMKTHLRRSYIRIFCVYHQIMLVLCLGFYCGTNTFHQFVAQHQTFILPCILTWAGHVARMGEGRGVYRVLVGKPEGKRPLGRPRRRWEDNINP